MAVWINKSFNKLVIGVLFIRVDRSLPMTDSVSLGRPRWQNSPKPRRRPAKMNRLLRRLASFAARFTLCYEGLYLPISHFTLPRRSRWRQEACLNQTEPVLVWPRARARFCIALQVWFSHAEFLHFNSLLRRQGFSIINFRMHLLTLQLRIIGHFLPNALCGPGVEKKQIHTP